MVSVVNLYPAVSGSNPVKLFEKIKLNEKEVAVGQSQNQLGKITTNGPQWHMGWEDIEPANGVLKVGELTRESDSDL